MTTQYQFLNMYKDNLSTHTVNCSVTGGGRVGGLALIWNHCIVTMNTKSFDLHYIDMSITNSISNHTWRATGIYGFPQAQNKYLTCQLINDLSCTNVCTK
jgi:hypothetical protein